MKNFLIAAVCIITLLLVYMGFRHNFGQKTSLPNDSEQEGLNDQIVINFSHVVAENTPKGLAANKFAELVEEKTDGTIQVEVYPNSILYSDDEELRAIQNGDVQMIAPSFSKVTALVPAWEVLDLPYLFDDYEEVREIFMGETRDKLLGMLAEYDVKGLALWNNGFKQMTTSAVPVSTTEDLRGLTFRTMPSQMLEKQFVLAGAKAMNANFDNVYHLLENKELDGQENTISNVYSKGFYQVQNHMTLTNHGLLGYAVLMNGEFWDSLPVDLQNAVTAAMEEATAWNFKQSEKMNEDSLMKIKASSQTKIHELSKEERLQWKQSFLPLYDYYRENSDAKLLKEIQEATDDSAANKDK